MIAKFFVFLFGSGEPAARVEIKGGDSFTVKTAKEDLLSCARKSADKKLPIVPQLKGLAEAMTKASDDGLKVTVTNPRKK
jgi:hypothetical protein